MEKVQESLIGNDSPWTKYLAIKDLSLCLSATVDGNYYPLSNSLDSQEFEDLTTYLYDFCFSDYKVIFQGHTEKYEKIGVAFFRIINEIYTKELQKYE